MTNAEGDRLTDAVDVANVRADRLLLRVGLEISGARRSRNTPMS